MNALKKEWKFWCLVVRSMFECVHLPSDLKVDELIERLKDEEEDSDTHEHWNCVCTCKCGEKVEQVFALMTYFGEITKRYSIREDVKDAVLAQAAIDKAEKNARQKAAWELLQRKYKV